MPTTTPIGVITASINPNVGWAKQLRLSIDAGTIYRATANEMACRLFDGNCFAPTIHDLVAIVDAGDNADRRHHGQHQPQRGLGEAVAPIDRCWYDL
ncbi:MAG: hypothetical protein ACJ8CR_22875 [Roseiflexaceae bacterium]